MSNPKCAGIVARLGARGARKVKFSCVLAGGEHSHASAVGDETATRARQNAAEERADAVVLDAPDESGEHFFGTLCISLDLRFDAFKGPDDPPRKSGADAALEEGSEYGLIDEPGHVAFRGVDEHEKSAHQPNGPEPRHGEAIHELRGVPRLIELTAHFNEL